MVEISHPKCSVRQQCKLLNIARSGLYYEPVSESALNLGLLEKLVEQYLKTPYYGSPKFLWWLRAQGYAINIKRVKRLMRVLGITAIYQKPNTSLKDKQHQIYPYLLKNLEINTPNQVWCSDITYLRMKGGFMYLVVVMDWYSRYVISWELSNSLETWFCTSALHAALAYEKPTIFNTDQGSQFTSHEFTDVLKSNQIKISMDGKGRYLDNIMIERLWRSLKYEDIYLKHYETVPDLYDGLTRYFQHYNTERPHQSLDYRSPSDVYQNQAKTREVVLC